MKRIDTQNSVDGSTKQVSVRMPAELLDAVDVLAIEKRWGRAEVVRLIVEDWLTMRGRIGPDRPKIDL